MQIDFKALEKALAPIEEIGQGELTFDMGSTPVTMRVLLPAEELEVQRYASEALPSGETEGDPNNAVDYLDRFRIGCIAHAIIVVGDLDFREVAYVEMGDSLDNGAMVKVPKVKALRSLVARWSRSLLTRAFRKYSELLNQVEHKAEQAIMFVPSDRDAEIERLETLLAELKTAKEQEAFKDKEVFTAKVDAALVAEDTADKVATVLGVRPASPERESLAEEDEQPPAPAVAPPAPKRTGPISPQQAAPPQERPAHQSARPQPVHPTPPRADSSFINADDDDSMNAAMQAEHLRLVEMRRRSAQGQRPADEASALERVHPQLQPPPRRRPPHLDAAEVEEELGLVHTAAQQARHMGDTPDGVPVYAMPAQDLEVPGAQNRPDRGAINPKTEAGGAKNPRFTPPRKP